MAAKLLQSLADDNPDLQKHIGCMTGIFQLFDLPHVLTARRITNKRLPPGRSNFSNGALERETNNESYRQTAAETNLNKSLNEKQRLSTESSGASSSSSCSSSLSTMECNRTQPEASANRIISSDTDTPSSDPVMNLSYVSPHSGRQSLDLRDVVKDSMYMEGRGLSVKAVKDETGMKHRDSPRPLLLSKSSDGSYMVDIDGKQNLSADLKESLRVLSKLREAPWYYTEGRELPRSSYDIKDGQWHSISKDLPRFSYDGKDIRRLSYESQDTFKATPKLKELPRLSLDSREGSMRTSSTDSKMCLLQKSFPCGGKSIEKVSNVSQSSGGQKRLPGVVAKLMGLETLPDSPIAGDDEAGLLKASSVGNKDTFSSSVRTTNPNMSYPSKFTMKDQISTRRKNSYLVMKPVSSSRFPIELAPWKQQNGNRCSRKKGFRNIKHPARTHDSFPSVFSEIEERLKDLEFKKSGRDLRALKQILETMQAKGLLDKEDQDSDFGRQKTYEPRSSSSQNSRSVRQPKSVINSFITGSIRASNSKRGFESPIVIMKPAKRVDKSVTSSIATMDCISDPNTKKASVNVRIAKHQSPRSSRRDAATAIINVKNTSSRNVRSTQSPLKSPQLHKENNPTSVKNSGTVSPRLQRKKVELERPPTPSSESSKPRRISSKTAPESTSPGGKRRPKFINIQHNDDQCQIRNDSRSLSWHGDGASLLLDGKAKALLNQKLDAEVTSSLQSTEINVSQSPSPQTKCLISDSIQQNSTPKLDGDRSVKELGIITLEQPSPVSVLDTSIYTDEALSPVKQILHAHEDDNNHETDDHQFGSHWISEDKVRSNSVGPALASEINKKKLRNIENLVRKLRLLNSSHDEGRTDYIASLCENTHPDHRYISEILLASGLLLRDLSSDLMEFQLHSSDHPINPELFFVLEQTHASTSFPKEECSSGLVSQSKSDPGKHHRKLLFDTVNEILAVKLASFAPSSELSSKPNKLAKKIPTAIKLLKELCYEVEQIQAKKSVCELEDEDDVLKSVLCEDVMHRSDSWTDFHNEIPELILDVERLVFKDLVDEVVIGEAGCVRSKPSRRRQLFAN